MAQKKPKTALETYKAGRPDLSLVFSFLGYSSQEAGSGKFASYLRVKGIETLRIDTSSLNISEGRFKVLPFLYYKSLHPQCNPR